MAENLSGLKKFWQELKRRKVIRISTVYAATAFIILQLVDIIAQPLQLPSWTLSLVIVLLVIGFIIAVMLSWVYDITPMGVKKTKPVSAIMHMDKTTHAVSIGWKITTYTSGVIIVALLVYNFISRRTLDEDISKFEKSIAVLPFINDSPNEENTYLINGIMEEVLYNLQTIKNLRIISRTSVEQYRNQTKSIPEIAKELSVNYIVEGSAQKYDSIFRLRVQLIMASKERHLWAKSYEQVIKEAKDIFSIQSQIAQAIAAELKAAITPLERQIIERIPTASLTAYEAYLKGQFYWRKLTPNDLETAMQYFEMAKEKDPDYALAYAGISDVWTGRRQMGIVSSAEASPKGMEAALKALALDSTLAEVHFALALMKTWGTWDWKGAESSFQKAIVINPNYAEAHAYYSHFLNIVGRPEEAMVHIDLALKLDPYNPLLKSLYGVDLLFVHKYDEAILAFQETLKMDPTAPVALGNLPAVFHYKGRDIEALELLKRKAEIPEIKEVFNNAVANADYIGAKRLVADILVEKSKTTYIKPTRIASNYAESGEKDKAIEWLEKAYQGHDPDLSYLLLPVYDNLRNDLRFQDLARRMNLPYK